MIPFVLLLASFQAAPPPVRHEVNVWVARDVAPSARVRLNINTRNVPVVHVDAFPVDGHKYFSEGRKAKPLPELIGASVLGWDVTISNPKNREAGNDHFYSRQVNMLLCFYH